jgi:hypothetical protein
MTVRKKRTKYTGTNTQGGSIMAAKKQVSDIGEDKKMTDIRVGQLKELLHKGWPPFHLLTVCVYFSD